LTRLLWLPGRARRRERRRPGDLLLGNSTATPTWSWAATWTPCGRRSPRGWRRLGPLRRRLRPQQRRFLRPAADARRVVRLRLGLASVDWASCPFTAPENLPARPAPPDTGSGGSGFGGSGSRKLPRCTSTTTPAATAGPCYATIQAAVDAAADGDTIVVQPGAYESFVVDGVDNLTLSGTYADAVSWTARAAPTPPGSKHRRRHPGNHDPARRPKRYCSPGRRPGRLAGCGEQNHPGQPADLPVHRPRPVHEPRQHGPAEPVHPGRRQRTMSRSPGSRPRLDPAWDAALSTTGMPASSDGGGLASEGGQLYLAPGAGSTSFSAYDPGADAWSARANVPIQMTSGASNPAADGTARSTCCPLDLGSDGQRPGRWQRRPRQPDGGQRPVPAGNFTQAGGVAVPTWLAGTAAPGTTWAAA